MKSFGCALLITFILAFFSLVAAGETTGKLPNVEPNDEGLYVQPWFLDTFRDVREDMEEAASVGKQLAILFEQKGCPYCREIHRVNLRIPEVVDYIKENFHIVQMNLWGDKEAIDLDGETLTEKKLGRKWGVQFTPTIVFLPSEVPGSPTSGREAKV